MLDNIISFLYPANGHIVALVESGNLDSWDAIPKSAGSLYYTTPRWDMHMTPLWTPHPRTIDPVRICPRCEGFKLAPDHRDMRRYLSLHRICCCDNVSDDPCGDCTGTQPSASVSGASCPNCAGCDDDANGSYSWASFSSDATTCTYAWGGTAGGLTRSIALIYTTSTEVWDLDVATLDTGTFDTCAWHDSDAQGIACISGTITGTTGVANSQEICTGHTTPFECDDITVVFG